jgi:hypothetical protein
VQRLICFKVRYFRGVCYLVVSNVTRNLEKVDIIVGSYSLSRSYIVL